MEQSRWRVVLLAGAALLACDNGQVHRRLDGTPDVAEPEVLEGAISAAIGQAWIDWGRQFSPLARSTPEPPDPGDAARLTALGITADGEGRLRRRAQLLDEVDLVPTRAAALPGVDCVAMISIDRRDGQVPYVYETLAGMFRELPPTAQINVLVGNADADYLSAPELLARGLAPDAVERVHVFPAAEDVSGFLKRELAPSKHLRGVTGREACASWNYARALRNYRGQAGMILVEDDISWSLHGASHFARALANERTRRGPLAMVSLFNLICTPPGTAEGHACAGKSPDAPALRIQRPAMAGHRFWCTQAMYFAAEVAPRVGTFVHTNLHLAGYDRIISEFLQTEGAQVGYVYPSIVQHVGHHSSLNTLWFPESACMAEGLSPLPAVP